jgi:membrane protein
MRFPGRGMSWKQFAVGLKNEITQDNVTDIAATVTYYGFLALFPFLLFLVALASVIITPDQAQQIVRQLSEVAPGAVTQIVGDRIQQLGQQQNVTLLGFGALGAIWAASGAITALMRALNTTYDVKESRPFWKTRGIALLMTLFAGVLALLAGLVVLGAPAAARFLPSPAGTVIEWLRLPVAGVLMMFLWALLYWVLPDVEQSFKFITPGSVVGVVIWVIASWGFSVYVSHFGNYDKTYGSIAGVIVLLFWMWISAVVLLAGAEMNAFLEHASPEGKRQGAKSMADKGTTPATGEGARPGPGTAHPGPVPRRRRLGLATAAMAFAAGVLLARRESS